MSEWLTKLKKNRFVNFGLPFFVLIIGGSFGMKQFSQVRYDHRGQKRLTPEEIKELEKIRKPEVVTIEKEFEKIKKLDIDHWENKRGPRPWEPENPTNLELKQRAATLAGSKS